MSTTNEPPLVSCPDTGNFGLVVVLNCMNHATSIYAAVLGAFVAIGPGCGSVDRAVEDPPADSEPGDGDGDGDTNGDGDGDGGGWIYDKSCLVPEGSDVHGCAQSGGGHGGGNEDWCRFCSCDTHCSSDAECSSPEGTAKGVCRSGECMLDCSGGATCPAGRECLEWAPGEFECMFATNDEFACEGPWLCRQIENESDCNAKISEEGLGRCKWVVEDLYDDDSCVPSQTSKGRCVGLVPSTDGCATDDACSPEGPHAFYTDYGANTFGLWTLDECEWFPAESDSEICDFSQGFGLPLLCDCACD